MKKQTVGLQRNTTDKYYTNQHTAQYCIDKLREVISCEKNDLLIEPSAGNGSFINPIKTLGGDCLFYDLQPEHDEIKEQNYLDLNTDTLCKQYNHIHVIGNPPFGRQSSLAIKFIKKSCDFSNTVSFILPKSFKKESMQKHFPPLFHLMYEGDIPENSFIVNNSVYNVPCVFQIWGKKTTERSMPPKLIPQHYQFVKKSEAPDIAFRRVGVYAGKIYKQIEDKSEQSHYFLKFDKQLSDIGFAELNNIEFESKNNTVGPRSISKQELIQSYNSIHI